MQQALNKQYDHAENGSNQVTYVFEVQEDTMSRELTPKIRTGVWQILPSACASLTCIPFGLMFGWPSPTYPTLLEPNSPVPINLDQSAMIAGFLMLGISFGTLFSSKQIGLGPKYGIILGNTFILIGWVLMWQARDVFWLLGSRFVLGAGHGYGIAQIKNYIEEMTEEPLSKILTKQINFYGLIGLVLAYLIGPFIHFRQYSLISLIFSVFILFLTIFLPSTPKELMRAKKIKDAKRLLSFLKPDYDPEQEAFKIIQQISENSKRNEIIKVFRNRTLRNNFIKFTIVLWCEQYSGVPPTLVYTQIIFKESSVPYPEYFAIMYAIFFFLAKCVGTYLIPKYNKKTVLLLSSCSALTMNICKIFVIYYKINDQYFAYTSVIIMYLFIIVHTLGLGSIPYTLINEWFPKSCQLFLTKYFIILHSLFALTITKIFQVLLGQFGLLIPFYLFSGITVFAIIFISIFLTSTKKFCTINSNDCKENLDKK